MALLQIAEPGRSAAPHRHRLAAGIDLGTTNSLVASVRSGRVQTLPDEHGRHLLPSVVRYSEDGVIVGDEAKDAAAEDPLNTVSSAKRLVGRGLGGDGRHSCGCSPPPDLPRQGRRLRRSSAKPRRFVRCDRPLGR